MAHFICSTVLQYLSPPLCHSVVRRRRGDAFGHQVFWRPFGCSLGGYHSVSIYRSRTETGAPDSSGARMRRWCGIAHGFLVDLAWIEDAPCSRGTAVSNSTGHSRAPVDSKERSVIASDSRSLSRAHQSSQPQFGKTSNEEWMFWWSVERRALSGVPGSAAVSGVER